MNTLLLVVLLAPAASAQTTFDSEAWVPGKTGVGTASPGARFEARGSAATNSYFQASGVDLSPAFAVTANGVLGLSTASAARATVSGSADSGDLALELRGGDLWPATSNYQLTFGYAGGASYRHAIRSRHAVSIASNSLTFMVWTPVVTSTSMPAREALALVTHSTGVTAHVLPPASGVAQVQLAVSNGSTVGGGTMHRAGEASVSSALRKEGIEPLDLEAERAAYIETGALRHVRFLYKGSKGPERRGLLYEESPASIQRPSGSLSVDGRLLNAEMAAKELLRRLEALESQAGEAP